MKSFSSKIGVLLAAAGSAVGLGSIWKFPYTVGENGGGAFIIIYIAFSLVIGLPLLMNEFMIGKLSGRSAFGAFRTLSGSNRWQLFAWTTMVSMLLLTGFYFVVSGWCFYYMVEAAADTFAGMDAAALTNFFNTFEGQAPTMIFYAIIAIVLTASVLWFDVNKGIERLSKILMPLLFLMLIVLAIHMIINDESNMGLRFLFNPDFSKITPKVLLEAMGLSFFTLSLGVGVLITYGSYMPKDQDVKATSLQMIILVVVVSLLAGMTIFPAVFSHGFSPSEGPELTFVTLPDVFQQMFSPRLLSVIFFFLMCVAAITSTISMMEVMIHFFCDATSGTKHPLNRHQCVIAIALVEVVTNTLCVLSMTGTVGWLTIMGSNLFDIANFLVSDVLMPFGALGMAVFTGWFAPKVRYQGSRVTSFIYLMILRWVVPIALIIIFLNSINILKL